MRTTMTLTQELEKHRLRPLFALLAQSWAASSVGATGASVDGRAAAEGQGQPSESLATQAGLVAPEDWEEQRKQQ